MRQIGRYLAYREIASGGMASILLGCLPGPFDFTRRVAIKELHRHLLNEPEVVAMFMDEARLASRIIHPNVVPVLDVAKVDENFFLVMDYVEGESFAAALHATHARGQRVPKEIALTIVSDMLRGLHAAHELRDADDQLLGLIHRDVSPQNILVGTDGVTRLVDFGIAKARDRIYSTRGTDLKGKVPYMAPEQLQDVTIDRRCDLWAAGVVLWEALAGRRLFSGDNPAALIATITTDGPLPSLAKIDSALAPFDPIFRRLLARNPERRPSNAEALLRELAAFGDPARPAAVAKWIESAVPEKLQKKRMLAREMDLEMRSYHEMSSLQRLATVTGAGESSVPRIDQETTAHPTSRAPSAAATTPHPVSPWGLTFRILTMLLLLGGAVLAAIYATRTTTTTWVHAPRVRSASATAIAPTSSTTSSLAAGSLASNAASAPSIAVKAKPRSSATTAATPMVAVTTAPAAAITPPANCIPPYTVGPPPDFIKTMKRECL
jgi:eukaryotic-like serine/threonine-protein kinase